MYRELSRNLPSSGTPIDLQLLSEREEEEAKLHHSLTLGSSKKTQHFTSFEEVRAKRSYLYVVPVMIITSLWLYALILLNNCHSIKPHFFIYFFSFPFLFFINNYNIDEFVALKINFKN